jgi:hypothetical protein
MKGLMFSAETPLMFGSQLQFESQGDDLSPWKRGITSKQMFLKIRIAA